MKYILMFFLLAFVSASCGRKDHTLRNTIAFNDEMRIVSDSISNLESLLRKLPPHQMQGSFLDNEGYLYVNTERIGLLKKALYDSTIINNPVFRNFDERDYKKFISLTKFLLKNHIGASRRDNLSNLFVHDYRKTNEYEYNDLRYIMVNVDTASGDFAPNYRVLDRKGNVILVSMADGDQ